MPDLSPGSHISPRTEESPRAQQQLRRSKIKEEKSSIVECAVAEGIAVAATRHALSAESVAKLCASGVKAGEIDPERLLGAERCRGAIQFLEEMMSGSLRALSEASEYSAAELKIAQAALLARFKQETGSEDHLC